MWWSKDTALRRDGWERHFGGGSISLPGANTRAIAEMPS